MSELNDPPENFRELQDAVDTAFGDLFDMNHNIFSALRQNVDNLTVVRDAFLLQAEKIDEVINLLVLAANMIATSTGDLILSQFNVVIDDEEPDDDE